MDMLKLLFLDEYLWITDSNLNILSVNTNLLTKLNATEKELLGKNVTQFITLTDRPLFLSQLQKAAGSLEPIEFDCGIALLNGESSQVHWRALYRDSKLLLICRDPSVNYIKGSDLQKELNEQQAKMIASTKMAALGEMSGGIAHEINNPLTVIQARAFQLSQLADINKLEPAKVRQVSESISKTADKIARIIKSLRSFARDGAQDPFDVMSVKQVIDETLEFCRTRFYNHGVEVTVGEISEDLEFECRLVQIEQVLLNLLNNSFDAVLNLEERWIRIDVEEKDDEFIAIHVTDSGKGIPINVANQMMQPFFTTKEVGKGTGLGLSISNGIMKTHQGELVYDPSCPNTRFSMLIPKLQNTEN